VCSLLRPIRPNQIPASAARALYLCPAELKREGGARSTDRGVTGRAPRAGCCWLLVLVGGGVGLDRATSGLPGAGTGELGSGEQARR
jgi:hypothetical protein